MNQVLTVAKRELKEVKFLGEKGNPNPRVRASIKDNAVKALDKALDTANFDLKKGKDGALYIPLYTAQENGEVIYARMEMTITTKSPYAEPVKKEKTEKETTELVIPAL